MPNFSKNLTLTLARLLASSLQRLGDYDVEGLARHYGQHRERSEVGRLAFFSKCLAIEFYGITNEAAVNGEAWLIRRTAGLGFKTIFDVGANVGDWAGLALASHPAARLHCFEIVPSTFAALQKNLSSHLARCVLNPFGLSDGAGTVKIYLNPTSNLVSSMYTFGDASKWETVDGELQSGSAYVQAHGIEHIDYLKIDVEGAEALVLKGLVPELAAGKIRLLHFEYNRGALESRFLLKDFYALLQPLGFCLGKLYPHGVMFQDYRWDLEDFVGPNYVACRKDDAEMIALLKIAA